MTLPYLLSIFVCGLQLASALPASKIAGSADINHVIQHTHEDVYYRRDSSFIYARGTSSCTPLTLDQAKLLPGWSKIQQYATNTYGDGGVNIVVNPPEYPNAPATICLQDGPIPITVQGTPSCTSSTGNIAGTITGTTGTMSLSAQQGLSNTATWTVTQESSLAVGVSLSATFGLPAVDSVTASVTTTATITNSLSKSFSTTVDNEQTQSLTVNIPEGKNCVGVLTTKSCNLQGTGAARFVASGSVWFNYDDARVAKNAPNGGSHYKYAVDIASVLTNIDDRSSSMTFSGAMQVSSKTNFGSKCS